MPAKKALTKGTLQNRMQLLMQFVERYAKHDGDCPTRSDIPRCTCGFVEMLYKVRNGFVGGNLKPPQADLFAGEEQAGA